MVEDWGRFASTQPLNRSTQSTPSRRNRVPQLILLDMVMPVLDGTEALRILKSNPVTKPIPVVMMTALSETSEESLLATETGAAAFINKPLTTQVVGLLLEKHVTV